MKRAFSALACSLMLLSACGNGVSVGYRLTFHKAPGSEQDLALASLRVIERRLQNMDEELRDKEVKNDDGNISLIVHVANKEAAEELTRQMTEPFTAEIMEELPVGSTETADIVVEGQGSFKGTGISSLDIIGVDARPTPNDNTETPKGEARIRFSDEGKKKMQELFRTHQNKAIGLFVRGRLVSKLTVKSLLPDDLTIRDIPSSALASVFADDMNVGLHVTFAPLP